LEGFFMLAYWANSREVFQMRRLILAVCCVVVWSGCAEGKLGIVGGVGALSCAKYAQMYRVDHVHTDRVFGAWMHGYISGINVARGDGIYSDMGARTPEEMIKFLRKYCNDHPLGNFLDGANELWKSLPFYKYEDDPAPNDTQR
jgi:hypothetical protein